MNIFTRQIEATPWLLVAGGLILAALTRYRIDRRDGTQWPATGTRLAPGTHEAGAAVVLTLVATILVASTDGFSARHGDYPSVAVAAAIATLAGVPLLVSRRPRVRQTSRAVAAALLLAASIPPYFVVSLYYLPSAAMMVGAVLNGRGTSPG